MENDTSFYSTLEWKFPFISYLFYFDGSPQELHPGHTPQDGDLARHLGVGDLPEPQDEARDVEPLPAPGVQTDQRPGQGQGNPDQLRGGGGGRHVTSHCRVTFLIS